MKTNSLRQKRIIDLMMALTLLVLLSPLLLEIGFLIRILLGSPIIFSQRRPGLHGRPFTLYKFRTMQDACGNPLPDERHLISFGRVLRNLSLDELPALFNVIKGEMSLVGPRPLLMQYLNRYTPEQMRRHEALPGLTGWAQVNGRNVLSWGEKFALNVWYIDHRSLWLDAKIMALTIWEILKRESINQRGKATAEELLGERN